MNDPRDPTVLANENLPLDWTGEQPPAFRHVPRHVAIVMDGNGRWANERGLPRVAGHTAGEASIVDVTAGAVQAGVQFLSVYAFSTENWRRSPDEVRFLMGYNRQVLRRRTRQFSNWNVRIHWSGQERRLWRSVIAELRRSEQLTRDNTGLQLALCVNYGGRSEIVDAVRAIAADVAAGRVAADAITDKTISRAMYLPQFPDVDLFIRTSGEHRTSNFQLWESAYAELVFTDAYWPEFGRKHLWAAIAEYERRDRRFGGAKDAPGGTLGPGNAAGEGNPAPDADVRTGVAR